MSAPRPALAFWVVGIGTLLLELAWAVALPAFRGLDEFAHAFRADSLVHGQLLSRVQDPHGPGQLVEVGPALADAARPQCASYSYTTRADCFPVSVTADGRVAESSTAARYNPVWYVVAGAAALPWDGTSALFAMRAVTALGTASLVGWAAAVLARWDSSGWTLAGLLLTFTPMALYSGGVAAPNGIAYGAGLLLWASLVSLLARPEQPPLLALVVSACLLAHTHTTGVLWLAVTAVALLLLRSPRWWASWVRVDPRRRAGSLAAITLAGAAAVAWVVWAHTNAVGEQDTTVSLPTVQAVAGQVLVWVFQTVGAFPDRSTPAPLAIYVLWFTPTVVLLATGLHRAGSRCRRAITWTAACWVVIPVVLTLLSFRALTYAWQGRYALPLVEGIVLLAASAVALSPRPPSPRLTVVVPLLTLAHVWAVVTVARSQQGRGLGFAIGDHLPHTPWLVAALALAGGLLPLALGRGDPRAGSQGAQGSGARSSEAAAT